MAKETSLRNDVLRAASGLGARLFRNNVGQGWVGRLIKKVNGSVTLAAARPLHAGLCVGSSDLIGWQPVIVTPEMVGSTIAVFVALELKTPGVATTDDQARFIKAVVDCGGRAGIVRSVDEAAELLTKEPGG